MNAYFGQIEPITVLKMMPPAPPRTVIELFHLAFLRALMSKAEDKAIFSLKGGCNLRFYFQSARYSEAMDLDAIVIAKGTLKNKIDRLMNTPALIAPLLARGLSVAEVSAPKQTETTQRWKIGLRSEGQAGIVRTKVEFSRRDAIEGSSFEAVGKHITQRHDMAPFLAAHYGTRSAISQKIRALANRVEPQARDVFDLELLLYRNDAANLVLAPEEVRVLPRAIDRAMSISFDEYMAQVVSYLEPEQAELRASRTAWDTMQSNVVNRLQALS